MGGRAAQVAEQRERLRVTLASIGDAVIVTDTDGKVTFANPVAQALTGWADADAQGQPLGQAGCNRSRSPEHVVALPDDRDTRPVERDEVGAPAGGERQFAHHGEGAGPQKAPDAALHC